MTYINQFTIKDSANLDAFSRVRTSTPTILFESTFEYDLAPLKYEQITSSGAIAHDATDSNASLTITAATGLAAHTLTPPTRSQLRRVMCCAG